MKDIVLGGDEFSLPESWEEVDRRLLPALLKQLFILPESGETYHELLRLNLGYTPRQWKKAMHYFLGPNRTPEQRETSALALADTLRLISWMWTSDLTVRPFDALTVGGQRWLVFDEGFAAMEYGELCDAYIHAQTYIKQLIEGDDRLDLLIATICRPERTGHYTTDTGWNGDRREPYNDHLARRRADQLAGKFWEEKIALLMYFIGTTKDFFARFDIWNDDESAPAPEERYPGQALVKNLHLLSEKHIFGGMKETKSAHVYEVFQYLEEHHLDLKREADHHKAQNQA